jgi:hypothetical protein
MRRLWLSLLLLLVVAGMAMATDATQSGRDASGLSYRKLQNSSVIAPYQFWCWTKVPASPESGTNLSRFTTTHDMRIPDTAAGVYVPIAGIDVFHTSAAATDSITLYIYNGAVLDSMLWISSAIGLVSFPVIGDSVLFKAGCKSHADDWIVTTYFER